jgi:hypothetical protein
MVHEGCDLVAAARASGLRPDTLRRHLHRIVTIGFIHRERKAFRAALCSSNEYFLGEIRSGDNSMAAVNAIKVLEQLDDEQHRAGSDAQVAGITIQIVNNVAADAPAKVIDATDE